MAKHTKESIIQALKSLAEQLGKQTLSEKDLRRASLESVIRYHFGNIGDALDAAGLDHFDKIKAASEKSVAQTISDDDLFISLHKVEVRRGHAPGYNEYNSTGQYSFKPFRTRFGKWKDVLAHYRKWKAEHPEILTERRDETPKPTDFRETSPASRDESLRPIPHIKVDREPRQLYGEPIDFRGLRHAPINEQGVVYLFGMVSRELGFSVESLQQGFPDCEAKYCADAKKRLWGSARIEFEFKSSNFLEHGHNPEECDFIVCWEHDWPECPVQVIELRSEIRKLPSR